MKYTKLLIGFLVLLMILSLINYFATRDTEETPVTPVTPVTMECTVEEETIPTQLVQTFNPNIFTIEPLEVVEINRQTMYATSERDVINTTYSGHTVKEYTGGVPKAGDLLIGYPLASLILNEGWEGSWQGEYEPNLIVYMDEEFGPVNVIGYSEYIRIDPSLIGSVVRLDYDCSEEGDYCYAHRFAIILDPCDGCYKSFLYEHETRVDIFGQNYDPKTYDIGYVKNGLDNANMKMTYLRKGWNND